MAELLLHPAVEEEALEVGHVEIALPEWVREPWTPGQKWSQTETQRAFHLSPARVRVLSAGFGSGKTVALLVETAQLALENLGCPVFLLAPTATLSEDLHEPGLLEVLERAGLHEGDDYVFQRSQQRRRIDGWGGHSRGGWTINFRSFDNPARLVGHNAAAVLIDEPALCRDLGKLLQNARRRVRHPAARHKAIVLAGTPDAGTAFGRLVMKPPRDAEVFYGSTDDNPMLEESYLRDLEDDYPPETIDAYRHGRPVVLTGRAYTSFRAAPFPDEGNLREWTYDPERPVVLAVDNNRNPMAAVLSQMDGGVLQSFAEVHLKGGSWRALAERVHQLLAGVAPAGFILHGDAVLRTQATDEASSWGAFANIRDHLAAVFEMDGSEGGLTFELRCPEANPLVVASLEATNRFLCSARGVRRWAIDPRCDELIEDLETNTTKDDGSQIDKRDKARTHWADTMRYVISREWPLKVAARSRATGFRSA